MFADNDLERRDEPGTSGTVYARCSIVENGGVPVPQDGAEAPPADLSDPARSSQMRAVLNRTAPLEPESLRATERRALQTLDDAGVVAAHLTGDPQAFEELVERYQKRLLNFVYRTIGDRERGEDLVQEVFIRVHRHLHRFDQTKKFSTWIYTIASNLAKNELRNRSRNPLVLFQTIKKNWEADHRPLQFEDKHHRPDDL